MDDQYYPLPLEYLITGLVGILSYGVILYYSLSSAVKGFRSKSTRRFFGAVTLMALLELPRFFALAIDKSYTSRITYSIHTVAGIFFFLAFSIVCRQWSGLLQLGSYFRFVYGFHGLIIANIIFAGIDIITVIICMFSSSLQSFFDSTAFEVITFFEGIRNCIYSAFLTYYGLRLAKRFWHFSKLEQQQLMIRQRHQLGAIGSGTSASFYNRQTTSNSITFYTWCGQLWSIMDEDHIFHNVVIRLTIVLVLSTLCFTIRVIMLIVKMIALHSDTIQFTAPTFTLFGFLWFTFSDFIPRTLPTLAFIFLMRTKKPIFASTQQAATSPTVVSSSTLHPTQHQGRTKQEITAFQFVKLSTESEDMDHYFDYTTNNGLSPFTLHSMDEEENSVSDGSGKSLRKALLTGNTELKDCLQIGKLENGSLLDDTSSHADSRHGSVPNNNTIHSPPTLHIQHPNTANEARSFSSSFFSFNSAMKQNQSLETTHSPARMQMNTLSPTRPNYGYQGVYGDEGEEDDEDEDDLGPGETALNNVFSLFSHNKK